MNDFVVFCLFVCLFVGVLGCLFVCLFDLVLLFFQNDLRLVKFTITDTDNHFFFLTDSECGVSGYW